jgi:hypothetical protein
VHVSFAGLAEGGFVVIQDELLGPGRFSGVSVYLPEGQTRAFDVRLKEPTGLGYHYAIVRRDDGDRVFDPRKDHPARDARGSVVLTRFLVDDRFGDDGRLRP